MALFKKWEEAWNNNDASGWLSLLHEDYQFTFHSSGNNMKKADMTVEMMTSAMEKETIKIDGVSMKMMKFSWFISLRNLLAVTRKPLCW